MEGNNAGRICLVFLATRCVAIVRRIQYVLLWVVVAGSPVISETAPDSDPAL